MVFFVLLLVPGVVGLLFYLFSDARITGKEFALMMAVQVVVAGISAGIIYYANTHDVEIWNGRVTKKTREEVTCSHEHCCAWTTYTYACGKSTCSGVRCSGYCKDHPFDVDWPVYTSLGERIEIDRLSRQGLEQPPRWTTAIVGEPSSTEHSYENYIKAAPDTLFRRTQKQIASLPPYPDRVYDYYRSQSFYPIGLTVFNAAVWNKELNEVNAKLGKSKQVNIFVVPVLNKPRDYFYDLETAWLGGKKNDVIIVAGVNADLQYQWVEVMSWTKSEILKVTIRDELMVEGVMNPQVAVPAIEDLVQKHFVRREMKDFEYLKSSITPTPNEWFVSLLLGIGVAVIMGIVCHKHDLFGEERFRSWPRRF
jgi:hypothetical protein